MLDKRKQGEEEAMRILKAKGISFNEKHNDEGDKGYSVPDLQYSDGRYLEVTHTLHNNGLIKSVPRNYCKKSLEEQYEIAKEAREAYERIRSLDYPFKDEQAGRLTTEGTAQFVHDKKIVNNHFGKYDERTGRGSEFDCDIPIVEFSSDNILREICEKGKKYPKGNTDLFIFVDEEEYKSVLYLIETRDNNGNYQHFMRMVLNSPFKTIFICVWIFFEQRYVIENPIMMKFWKSGEGLLHYQRI